MKASVKIFLSAIIILILAGVAYMIWGRGLAPESFGGEEATITSPFLNDDSAASQPGATVSASSAASARVATKEDLIGIWDVLEGGIDEEIMFLVSSAGKNVYSSSSGGEDSFVGCSWSYEKGILVIDCAKDGIKYTFNNVMIAGGTLTIKGDEGFSGVYERQE